MSIRKRPEQAVSLLLARLDKAKDHALQQQGAKEDDANEIQSNLSSKFDDFKTELRSMKGVFRHIKNWENMIMVKFCALEQELDNFIFREPETKSEVEKKLELMTTLTSDISALRKSIPVNEREITRLMTVMPSQHRGDDHQMDCTDWRIRGVENKILESIELSSFFTSFHCLSGSEEAKMCSLCLAVFPKNSVIEKKPLIYWWIGEGLVMNSLDKTAEEVGEEVFRELLDVGFIRPSGENTSLSVNSFDIDPWIHRMLIRIAKENLFSDFSPQWTPCNGKRRAFLHQGNGVVRISGENEAKEAKDVVMVFNVDARYLRMKPVWLSLLRNVEVLQMGRWQNSASHHIEVKDQTLFDALGSQKHLKYLSLRGISRVETLPNSISGLISLQILDLRACHNLEKLPPTISRLKKLTHLDVSHCYLLESMPKGVEQLVALQVVKGFVIGKADKNSCKISDLARLVNLRKLSIRMGETQQDDQLGALEALPSLRILTISWGDVSSAQGKPIPLPEKLTKLDLRCVPFESVPEWLSTSKLPKDLYKLYIKGGKLKSLKKKDVQGWRVRFLRFKYLDDLEINEEELLVNYKYLDKFDCYELRSDITSTTPA